MNYILVNRDPFYEVVGEEGKEIRQNMKSFFIPKDEIDKFVDSKIEDFLEKARELLNES